MKILMFFFCVTVFSFAPSIVLSQNTKIKIDANKTVSIDEVFDLIMDQTDYTFIYQLEMFNDFPKVKLKKGLIPANKLLEISIKNDDFSFDIVNNNTIVIKRKATALKGVDITQHTVITGTITDENNMGLPGVNVLIKESRKGVMTDFNGAYKIEISGESENVTLVFSFLGYKAQEIAVGNQPNINVKMIPESAIMEEVVVIGYGTSKIKDMTGSVSRISKQDLENAPMVSTVESMLQGKSAGVNVTIQSVSPTSPISVVIRGASSLSGDNQPLWVIDGVPQYSSSTSGNIANTLYNLNLNDVQSIDILKDASATAVYGSRAANGVVIVTTKKGIEEMKPSIEYSSRVGVQIQDFNDYKYFNTEQYISFSDTAAREAVFTEGDFDFFTRQYLDVQAFYDLNTSEFDRSDLQIGLNSYYNGKNDWQKEVTQNPIVVQHDLSVRGGTEATTYYVSFNYKDVEGILKSGKSEIYGGRLNFDTKIRDNITFGLNISGSTRKSDDKDHLLATISTVRPDLPAFNEDGTIFTRDLYTENPYTTLRNTFNGKGLTFSGTGFLAISIMKHLQLKSSFTNNFTNSERLRYERRGSVFNLDGTRNWTETKSSINVWENTLTYARLHGKHDVSGLAGYSMENSITSFKSINASNFPDDDILNNFGAAANLNSLGETITENALISEFARVHYKYDDRYIVSGTVRGDGSSRFGVDRKWGFFPSGAIAWLVTGEKFMQKKSIKDYISYLKLRSSMGLTGSQNLGDFDYITQVRATQFNESPAILPSSIGNPSLQWEQTKMIDIGIDFGFLDDRIWGSFGVYRKKSDELIFDRPLPTSSAFSTITSNVAAIRNDGIEFDIKYDIIRNFDNRLTFDFNISKNTGKVTKINGVTEELLFPNDVRTYMITKAGDKVGEWFGYQTAGRLYVTPEEVIALQSQDPTGTKNFYRDNEERAGDLYVIDQNNDGVINEEDRVKIGTSIPKAFGGFGLTFGHKGFLINTTFTYAFGHKRFWQQSFNDLGVIGNGNQSNLIAGQSATVLSPYDATFPRVTMYGVGDNNVFSDFFLYDASYLRLTTLNISYKVPTRVFKDMLIQGIDLTFQATNLFTFTKYPGFDPQGNWTSSAIGSGMGIDSGIYPSAQLYNFGVKIKLQ